MHIFYVMQFGFKQVLFNEVGFGLFGCFVLKALLFSFFVILRLLCQNPPTANHLSFKTLCVGAGG